MKGKWRRRIFTFVTAMMAGLLMSHGLTTLANDLSAATTVYADSGNTVTLSAASVQANAAGLIYVDIIAEGNAGDTVAVTYRTSSGTAIEGVDYLGAYNVASLKIDPSGSTKYTVSIKCLNDAETREKLRLYEGTTDFGRYFNLSITEVSSNASISGVKTCKCYLPYDYKVSVVTNDYDPINNRRVAYLEDYKNMISKYHKGENDISGKETWKTWKKGVNFDSDETRRWVNAYINRGFAHAYGSYVLSSIDDDKLHSNSNIYMLSGNREFMDKYDRSSSCPGLSLYYEIEPCTKGGYRIDGRAMYYIANDINPWKKDGDLVDLEELHVVKNPRQIYWRQKGKTWYSNDNTIYDSMFYRTDPYNGILDYGLAIFNNNKSWDREVHNIWLFLTLIDDKAPSIIGNYTEYNRESGCLRIFLRFDEPVYAARQESLTVKINGYNSAYSANYVDGNFSDTLVYEVPSNKTPNVKITSVTYELPSLNRKDIGDLAYNVNPYGTVENNLVQGTEEVRNTVITGGAIDLAKPQLSVDRESSYAPQNVYDLMISANGNGATSFDSGTVYYTFDKNESIPSATSPTSYANSHVLTSEERGSFGVTLIKNESLGIDSGKYYLHALAVSQYGFTSHNTFGPYVLDGDVPEVSQFDPNPNELKSKTYSVEIKNKALNTAIDKVTLALRTTDAEGVELVARQPIVSGGEIPASLQGIVSKDTGEGKTIYKYRSSVDEDDTTVPLDSFILNLMGERPQLVVEAFFEVVDAAGNKATTSSFRTVYDKRTLFVNDITVPVSYHEDTSIDLPADVFDITASSEGEGIRFEVTDPDTKALITGGAAYTVLVNGETEFPADGFAVTLKDLEPGYYEAMGHIKGNSGGTEVDLVAKTYSFYLTRGMDDATINKTNVQGNLVLTNHVFQLEDAAFYYYNTANSSVMSHLYGAVLDPITSKYNGGSTTPTFSSSIEAKKYVKYMEYQDLEVISISSSIASLLNGGSGSTVYVKAPKETKNAQEGQLWVRYKKASWTASSGAGGWAFYYYGEGKVSDGINVNGLSNNLSASIDAVTTRIVSSGIDRYLVGEDYTNRITGAPYLADSQMHVSRETYSQTKSGNTFVSDPVYKGDENLFQNEVSVDSVSYPLATNLSLEVGVSTSLYYKYIGTSEWNKIEAADGTLLKDALANQASGLYTIREYGEAGVAEFTVYLDRSLPILNVTLNKDIVGEDENPISLDGNIVTLTCKNICLDELVAEADDEAFVAIYSYPNRSLMTVLYGDAIPGYTLAGGNYYLLVGDRSGNVVSYVVRTADSSIDISVTENSAKSGVIVRVNNRDTVEIYSYEVYLNETLIDNEFDVNKFYRGSGVYRVEIIDIYGNSETRTLTHEAPSPELTWFYMNDSGGYSVYDPEKPARMVLKQDPESSRTTNVYSSMMVRVMLNASDSDDVQFEMLDIDSGDYTYNPSTGMLTVNSLVSWRLRVWYKNQPENDRTYVFHVDNTAPEISASFMGTAYHPYVEQDAEGNIIATSTFDNLNFDGYEENDVATLDTLEYEKDGQMGLTFSNGGVISTDRIALHIADPSGIRSLVVTRNGQTLDMQLSSEGELIINNYGTYVITVTDQLGNVAVFTFTNVEGDISSGTIDGEILPQDISLCGHDAVEIAPSFDGVNTILVDDNGNSYTYEFHYENGRLTYGQYYIFTGERRGEDDAIETYKYAEYRENASYVLARESDLVKRGVYYEAVEMATFTIYAMIDDQGMVHYRIVALGPEITVESRFVSGSVHLPNRYVAVLSKEAPTLVLLTGDQVVDKSVVLDYIYVSDVLSIDKTALDASILTIAYQYSEGKDFSGDEVLLYADGEWLSTLEGNDNGYYRIVVTNIFHNTTVYLVNKIDSFASIVTIRCLDGSQVTYKESHEVIYSNYAIDLTVFSTEVHFEVDGEIHQGIVDAGSTTLQLSRDGTYHVRVVGSNGVFEDFVFEIRSVEDFIFQEDWIVGYNEEALLHSQGYTNTLCSIIVNDNEDVVFVDMVVNDEKHVVLYDAITDEGDGDKTLLHEAIGRYGIGKYTVGFRNKYGDLVTKTVYYNNIPSIVLSRTTTSDPNNYQIFDLGLALERGFYSNNVLRFSTDSTTYVFKINDESYRLDEPKIIEFSNASGKGRFGYRVSYIDEYGNKVEFDAVLYRDDVAFDSSTMKTMTVNNVLYTKDDVSITFADGLKATLTVDGGETKDYFSGEMHYADGEYRFVVRDIAGNIATYIVIHKSANHYSLAKSSTGEEVVDGGVVNNASVTFSATDGSHIKYVVRDGELLPEYSSATFSATGHYEIIIEDMVGNQSYEEFTILNNSLATFTYTAPFEYEVTEVSRIGKDGKAESIEVIKKASITLDQNGDYLVVVSSTKTSTSFNFSVSIDNTPPTATLVGVDDGGITARDVTLSGLKVGDVVKIYKDGELISTTTMTISTESPTINSGGKYKVQVTNLQGVTVEYAFTRKAVTNVAGSIFFIVTSALIVIGLGIGLAYHTKLKTDD